MELRSDDPEMIDDHDSDTKVGGQMLQQPHISIEAAS